MSSFFFVIHVCCPVVTGLLTWTLLPHLKICGSPLVTEIDALEVRRTGRRTIKNACMVCALLTRLPKFRVKDYWREHVKFLIMFGGGSYHSSSTDLDNFAQYTYSGARSGVRFAAPVHGTVYAVLFGEQSTASFFRQLQYSSTKS